MAADDQLPIKINIKADTKDASKVIEKLLDTIKAPFSWWSKSREPVTQAKAEVEATLIRVKAIEPVAEALGISKEEATGLVFRSEQREYFDRLRQQRNIESVVQGAIEMAPSSVNDRPVDEDWTADFFDSCKNIGDTEMQTLWSRILAGEVAEPGSFSKRALSFVKSLSKAEAQLFTKFCGCLWHHPQHGYLYIRVKDDNIIGGAGVSFRELLELGSLGLISVDDKTALSFNAASSVPVMYYFDEALWLYPRIKDGQVSIPALPLTQLGESLSRISGAKPNENYKAATFELLSNQNIVMDQRPPRPSVSFSVSGPEIDEPRSP
jgi:hypothetical protein